MRYIKEYHDGDYCKGIYLCKSKLVLTAKTGKTYYSLMLQDKSGSMDAKVFDINSGIDDFDAKMNILDKAYDGVAPGEWTQKVFTMDDRYFYNPLYNAKK